MDALISDVHANLAALEVVLEDIDRRGVDRVFCLGDMIGYGPQPAECLDLLMKRCEWCLMGNHEYAVLHDAEGFNPIAEVAVDWTREQIVETAQLKFLRSLKSARLEENILYVHGSVHDPLMDYVREVESHDSFVDFVASLRRDFRRFDLCFTGHNHRAFLGTEDAFIYPHEVVSRFHVRGRKLYVCIGSVGQPRDDDPRACYVTFDGDSVEYHRLVYDVESTARLMRKIPQLHPFLAERLFLGE